MKTSLAILAIVLLAAAALTCNPDFGHRYRGRWRDPISRAGRPYAHRIRRQVRNASRNASWAVSRDRHRVLLRGPLLPTETDTPTG
jgi:hypothetical protein